MTTQRKEELVISREVRGSTGSVQWFLELHDDPDVFQTNNLEVLICGENSFESIASDIGKAKKSIDLICWGFDPAMEMVREGHTWPRGVTYGDLLADAAERGVKVRLLCWFDLILSSGPFIAQNNMPGFSKIGNNPPASLKRKFFRSTDDFFIQKAAGQPEEKGIKISDPLARREFYNYNWYLKARPGVYGVELRVRNGNPKVVSKSIEDIKNISATERAGMIVAATHHQKTILIDYEDENPIGYVMGLNSVTDYWDNVEHNFHESLRGEGWEGTDRDESIKNLKPYQDYVCRIRGEALVDLKNNFSSAWERADVTGRFLKKPTIEKSEDRMVARRRLRKTVEAITQRIQIVRTQLEEKDFQIERLYHQATSHARNYIYIENQYFQYTALMRHIKQKRKAFFELWQKAAGASKHHIPDLHLIVITPSPERTQMVPTTHESISELGYGSSMPNQDEKARVAYDQYNEKLKQYEKIKKSDEEYFNTSYPVKKPVPSAEVEKFINDEKFLEEAGQLEKIQNELGLRSLVASMFTTGGPGKCREIYIHSKLMIIDDSLFTLGSANTNLRSMRVDSELNMVTDDPQKARDLRERVWGMMTDGKFPGNSASGEDMTNSFNNWKKNSNDNLYYKNKNENEKITGFIVKFHDKRISTWRLG